MSKTYYIASCLFTARFPETSIKIQKYVENRFDIEILRCCIPNFRVRENTERILDENVREAWKKLPVSAEIEPGDTVYSLCHNCTNILAEQRDGVNLISLWELIDKDKTFVYPNYAGLKVTVQDCWRSREQRGEQDAVRSLLARMNIEYIETAENRENTNFCGSTLYREQPAKNAKFAPKHYVEQAVGKFLPHTPEEQVGIAMQKGGIAPEEPIMLERFEVVRHK